METSSEENPIVQTTSGKVRGQKTKTVYGHEYYYFDGIPFAEPPIGVRRFKAPQPVTNWTGTKDCTKPPHKSLQWDHDANEVQGSEDCLYLNINVKRLNTRPLLPVMVYVHGGGFNIDEATRNSLGPDYFMAKNVVFITVAYRLGILGFARFSDKSLGVPGNSGLKDVVLALKWIKANCVHFNGDPDNITLFGHSSGSNITHLLMQTPAGRGLFHKAILLAGFHMNEPHLPKLQYRLARHLGFKGSEVDEKALHDFLINVEASKLLNFDIFSEEEKLQYETISMFPFTPTMEDGAQEDAIITQSPVVAQRSCWGNSIPIMMGSNSSEALFQSNRYRNEVALYELFKSYPKYLLPPKLQTIEDENLKNQLGKQLLELHFGDNALSCENYECAIENASYNMTYHDEHRLMQSRLRYATGPTYVYRFDFDSPTFNLFRNRMCEPGVRGVSHVDELSYLFYLPHSHILESNSAEYKCIEQMVETFYAFAETSDPNNPTIQPAQWKPLQSDLVPECLNINYEWTKVLPLPEYRKCCARDDIYRNANIELY